MMNETIFFERKSAINGAVLKPNGKMIVTGSDDGTGRRLCTRSGDAIGELIRRHKCRVHCVAFTGNCEMVVTASFDKSIIRWTAAIGQQIGKPLLHNGSIRSIYINANSTVIVSPTIGF